LKAKRLGNWLRSRAHLKGFVSFEAFEEAFRASEGLFGEFLRVHITYLAYCYIKWDRCGETRVRFPSTDELTGGQLDGPP
jgi:hypothetical protein